MDNEKEAYSPPKPNPTPPEAPPAYESLLPTNTLSKPGPIQLTDEPTTITNGVSINDHTPHPAPPPFRPPARGHTRSLSSSSASSLKSKKSWFSFSGSSTTSTSTRKPNEVRTTVLNLVRDLVQVHSSGSPAALGILQSCAEACTSHSVQLSEILQDKFIESHSPLYWAIVKRRQPDSHEDIYDANEPDLLDGLLKHAAPLNGDTVTELRLACLATSDQAMFQRLRLLPQFTSVSGADQILLGAALPPDDVTVELGSGNEGAFAVSFQIPQFHKRMMISKEIRLEFIARSMLTFTLIIGIPRRAYRYFPIDRIWLFTFLITSENAWYGPPPGSWCVALSLQEPSPPTWFDGRLVLPDSDKHLRLKSKQMMEGPRKDIPATQIVTAMDDSPDFGSLQYS